MPTAPPRRRSGVTSMRRAARAGYRKPWAPPARSPVRKRKGTTGKLKRGPGKKARATRRPAEHRDGIGGVEEADAVHAQAVAEGGKEGEHHPGAEPEEESQRHVHVHDVGDSLAQG